MTNTWHFYAGLLGGLTLLLLPSCGSDGSPAGGAGGSASGVCAQCAQRSSACSWTPSEYDYCLRECEQRASKLKSECQNEYDKALVCFNDPSKWTCSGGPTGCMNELVLYDSCTSGAGTCNPVKVQACTVCDTLSAQCSWGYQERCSCRASCDYELTYEGDCQGPYDAYVACLADPLHWNCESGLPFQSCSDLSSAYQFCKNGDVSWKCKALQATAPAWMPVDGLPSTLNDLDYEASQGVAYAACGDMTGSGSGVYKSTDAGKTWASLTGNLPGGGITALAATATRLYVIADFALYSAPVGTSSWTKQGTEALTAYRPQLLADPTLPTTIYTFSSDGPLRSQDSGASWETIAKGLPLDSTQSPSVQRLAASADSSGTLYAATGRYGSGGNGVYKSINRGDQWTAANKGLLDATMRNLEVGAGGLVWALEENGDFYESTDAAATWQKKQISHPCVGKDAYSSRPVLLARSETGLVLLLRSGVVLGSSNASDWSVVAKSTTAVSEGLDPIDFVSLGNSKVLLASTSAGALRLELP